MGLGGDDSKVGKVKGLDVEKSKRSNKEVLGSGELRGSWVKLRFITCCISSSSRSKVDTSISGISTHCESKCTNDTSIDQPAAPVISSTATSIAESNSSTSKLEEELKISSRLRKFTFNDLKLATRNFRPESLLGEGGFGCVFKGWIEENGTAPVKPGTGLTVAVKTLNHDGLQGHKEWLAEVNFLGDLVHPNLVKLVGYCIEDDQRLLVYEFMPRGSLENHLFRRSLPLPWSVRMKIALGAAKGLAFLHEEAQRPVIYRDFKTSNILLDADYNAKLSDFGLAKDGPEGDKTHVSTRVMGTYGYAAPEYVMTGHLTSKSDVYSFGVVLLEMITGRRSMDKNRPNGEHNLVEWARPHLCEKRRFYRLIDPRLEGHFSIKGAQKAAFDVLDVGLGTQIYETESPQNAPKIGRKCAKRTDSIWAAWFFFSFYFKPVFNEKSKAKVVCDSNGVSGFDKSDLQLDTFMVQHDMENMYMWVFKERPESALGKMQLRSYMNGHSRQGERPFPFSVDRGFVRSHRMQRKHYRGLSNPQCVHGIEVVPSPNLSVLDEGNRRRWVELTGREANFTIPPEASDYSSWRNLPNTEFELERPPLHSKKLFNGSVLKLSTRPSTNGDIMDLSPVCNKRKDFFSHGNEEEDSYLQANRPPNLEVNPNEPYWLNEFRGVMRNVYGPVTAAKTIYEDEEGYLIIVSLPFVNLQRVKVSWRNTLKHGIIKVSCSSTSHTSFIKRHKRTFKLLDSSSEHCPPGEFVREIPLSTRIPEDANIEAYVDGSGTVLEILVPKLQEGPEEHEVHIRLCPQLSPGDLMLT